MKFVDQVNFDVVEESDLLNFDECNFDFVCMFRDVAEAIRFSFWTSGFSFSGNDKEVHDFQYYLFDFHIIMFSLWTSRVGAMFGSCAV